MRADLYPLQILLFTVSGWVNRRQQGVIAYLEEAGVQLIRTPRQAPNCNAYAEGEVCCRERLGGLLKHYYRAA